MLFVDSRDRVSGTTTDFSIQLPETMHIEALGRGRIDNLRIPLVIPTIQSGVNDTLQVRVGSTNYTVTLPQGQYDGPGIATVLQGLLFAAAPGTWTVAYDTANISMKISCSNAFTILGGTYGTQLMSRTYTSTPTSYSFTFVSMLGIDLMYLSSGKFANLDIIGPQGAHDTLISAIVNGPFGSVLDVSMPFDTWFNVPPMTTQQLDFQLRDRSYNVLTMVPNISFVLTID